MFTQPFFLSSRRGKSANLFFLRNQSANLFSLLFSVAHWLYLFISIIDPYHDLAKIKLRYISLKRIAQTTHITHTTEKICIRSSEPTSHSRITKVDRQDTIYLLMPCGMAGAPITAPPATPRLCRSILASQPFQVQTRSVSNKKICLR